jgi:hypothetical protein
MFKEISESKRNGTYHKMFGQAIFKGTPLFVYAENLFYSGMDQMVEGYNGGYFDFITFSNEEMEFEPDNFLPIINQDRKVNVSTPFTSELMSMKAATLVVWLFVVEQIANNIDDGEMTTKLYNILQDIKYSYNEMFDKDDRNAIYQCIN